MSGAEVLAAPGQNDDRPLVIFGTGALSSLAWYVFTHDSPREVAGFAVMEETTALRLDWRREQAAAAAGDPEPDAIDVVTLRVIWSMGPHKAHQF